MRGIWTEGQTMKGGTKHTVIIVVKRLSMDGN
jgi:hypothetical protein